MLSEFANYYIKYFINMYSVQRHHDGDTINLATAGSDPALD